MSRHLRLALACALVVAAFAARAGNAFASHLKTTHATAVQRERARIVRFARTFLGVRYSYGGTSPGGGFDCSGFTRFVYAHFGVTLPHYSVAQYDLGRRIPRSRLRAGDLVFFDGLGHVGLYIGGGRYIHAPHTGTRVSIDSLGGAYAYDGAVRIVF